MKPFRMVLLAAVVVVGGCASVPLPPEVAAIVGTQESSRWVALYPPKFVVSGEQLLLTEATAFFPDKYNPNPAQPRRTCL